MLTAILNSEVPEEKKTVALVVLDRTLKVDCQQFSIHEFLHCKTKSQETEGTSEQCAQKVTVLE